MLGLFIFFPSIGTEEYDIELYAPIAFIFTLLSSSSFFFILDLIGDFELPIWDEYSLENTSPFVFLVLDLDLFLAEIVCEELKLSRKC